MGFWDFFSKQSKPKRTAIGRIDRGDAFAEVKKAQKKVEAPALELTEETKKNTAPEKGFDPYNSGAYDRRGAWEKVTRK